MNNSTEKKQLNCDIVLDLLPLYYDKIVRDFTKTAVEEHLEQCPSCRSEFEALGKNLPIAENEVSTQNKFLNLLRQQKRRVCLKIIFLLSVISIFLPWFTYNARVMGYCCGYSFLKWFALPLVIIAVHLFTSTRSKILLALTELCMVANLITVVTALGRWQEVYNIKAGFQWEEGLYTALPGYWLAAVLFLLFFVVFQYDLWKKRK